MEPAFRDLTPDELIGHTRWLRRFALRLVADESRADDLAQQAWVELAKRDPRRGVADLRGFLAGIARRLAAKDREGRARRRAREERAARPVGLPDSAAMQAEIEAQRVVVEELERLEPELRDALLWRFYEGLPSAEIARRLGVPASTERARVARGLARLRERLDRRFGSDGDRGAARTTWCAALMRAPLGGAGATTAATLAGAGTMSLATKTVAATAVGTVLALGALFYFRGGADPRGASDVRPSQHERHADSAATAVAALAGDADERAVPETAVGGAAAEPRSLDVIVADAVTQLPADDYAVEVVCVDDERVVLWTDGGGRLTVPPQVARKARTLRALDHPDLHRNEPEELELPPAGERDEVTFAVALGPRYDLVLPPGAEPFTELAFTGGPNAPAAYLFDGLKLERSRFDFVFGAPLRRGELPWTRLELGQARSLSSGPWRLELRDAEGFWRFHAEVPTVARGERARLRLAGGPRSTLALRVLADGEPVTRLMTVALLESATAETLFAQIREHGPLGPGSDLFQHLPPGEYVVSSTGGGFEEYERTLELEAGEAHELVVELKRAAGTSDLVVRLESESGEFDFEMVFARATNAADPKDRRMAWLTRGERPGEQRFVLEGLTPGTWEVEVTGPLDLPFDPEGPFTVDAAAGEVAVTCLDLTGPPLGRTTLVLRDRATGEPVPNGGVALYRDGVQLYSTGFVRGECELFLGPEVSAGMDWLVAADGYRAHWVEDDAYPFAGAVDGRLVVELERGWGTLVVAQTWDEGFHPVAGQVVHADGVPVGETDSLGRLLVNLDAAPLTIHLPHETLHARSDALDPETGRIVTAGRLPPLSILMVE